MERAAKTIGCVLFALLASCAVAPPLADAGAEVDAGASDAGAYTRCNTFCVRPSDCERTYSSSTGYCPPGFLCVRDFSCVGDAGQ